MAKKISLNLDENTWILVITITIVSIVLILSYAIYRLHTDQIQELCSKINEDEKGLVIRRDLAKADNIIKDYKNYLYKDATTDGLRSTISALARESAVDIVSIQPSVSEKFGNYIRISFRVTLNASYDQLGAFIEKVERLGKLTKIEEIIIGEEVRYGARDPKEILPEKETRAKSSLTITAYCTRN